MRKLNSEFDDDIPLPLAQKIDGMVRLFDGDATLGEILSMDIPSQRAMIQARFENLRKSQEAYAQGKIDAYSRRYANVMGLGGASINSNYALPESNPSSQNQNVPQNTIDRSKSLNIKDMKR